MATKRLIEMMSENMKDKLAALNNAGKTTPAVTAPMANAYTNAAVLEKIEKTSRDFLPQEEHQNEFTISLSKQKGQR
ncbi:hypothetical protein F2Q70_00038919 [Brassica cretica]|uniref:Uncharacterized protein n=1 Tax=Brassica cretica TaxID=69181 RepID=A0A8S9MGE6_BRACR|nr:hypothetical protein F2Q70_00038919 [Brassica cretica]KAF2618112.1 hypothetical protein F2Q68_00039606 [Brassica cretica]